MHAFSGCRTMLRDDLTADRVPLAGSQRALIGRLDRDARRDRWAPGRLQPALGPRRRGAGGAGLERQRRGWATKVERRTPRDITRVDERPTARA
jgi:DNA polymerase V